MKIAIYSEKTKKQYILFPICTNFVLTRKGFVSYDHLHPVYHLVYMIQGGGDLASDARMYPLKGKDIFIVNPNEKHIYTSSYEGGMTHFTVNFYLLTIENYQLIQNENIIDNSIAISKLETLAETDKLDYIFDFKIQDVFIEYDKSKWNEALSQISSFSKIIDEAVKSPLYLTSTSYINRQLLLSDNYSKFVTTFFQLINAVAINDAGINKSYKSNLLNMIIKYLNEQLTVPFQLTELASSLSYSPVYISTYFKQSTGLTITQYINKLKIMKACEYLKSSDKTITEIASILNFSSSNHLSNNFKKEKNISPKDYRRYSEFQ